MLLKRNVELGLFIVRVLTGVIFLLHGFSKFQGGIGGTTGFFQSIGLPGFLAPVVAIIEILGGLLLILGLLTRIAGAALTVIMIGVLLTAKAGQPFMMGTEFDYLLLFTSLQLALTGSALLSVDSLLFKNKYNSRLAEN
ncbi:DoxX family protein [Paenibacillus sp. PsM32]|uniref:DoxX family protein n=1 Tax=unclassified Paenibacillus TaxID=185978 RepID=UPI00263A7994|nr:MULTISPECIES: DoxX family protein [unclassified Paenibacillus]MDN4620260.1 DoxX family protein [Paenibacillus sp. PsM32]MDQ1236000.1 putative oxidoreductase [Paenibacillus sp. SORGH_AS_0306]MDR6108357.1 putative oxidoreductase [Paenibacillus sp. SORGH_AS_0338]